MAKLTGAQTAAWAWTYSSGARRWHGTLTGAPPMAALMALVRRGYLTKRGGDGWPAVFERTEAGNAAMDAEHG